MMRERGLSVDHTTVWRWVQRYAPEINKRMRPHLKMSGTSYRLDETYVKVGTEWKYLYRAVDSAGDTVEFMPSAKRDIPAAKRFFRKLMRADHRRLPFTIGTDKHASYPEAFATSVKEKVLPLDCKTDSPLWTRHDRAGRPGAALSSHAFVKNLKRYAREAGVGDVHLHQTRHSFARIMAEETGSITDTQDALGHRNAATTRIYVRRIAVKRDKHSSSVTSRLRRRNKKASE